MSLPVLHPVGHDWRLPDETFWFWIGNNDLRLFARWIDGEDISPILRERRDYGFTILRTFCMKSKGWLVRPQDFGDGFYRGLREFAGMLDHAGLYVEFSLLVDAQDIMPNVGEQVQHVQQCAEALRGISNVFIELGNEWPKNGFNPGNFDQPVGVLASQGSSTGDRVGPRPGWSYHTFHGRRGWPKVLLSSVDPAFCIARGIDANGKSFGPPKPFIHDEPIGAAEVDETGHRSTAPWLFYTLGHGANLTGGGSFHSQAGLHSELFGPIQGVCAEHFVRGSRAR